jgi:hypothetical protein
VTESRGVLHRAEQDSGIRHRPFRLRKGDASSLGELAHFSELEAGKTYRQGADRMDVRLMERASAVLQHLDQTRLVERRIGVRRTREARHPSSHGGVHLRFERGLVFEARLAQARRKVDESRADDEAPASILRSADQPEGATPTAATLPSAM